MYFYDTNYLMNRPDEIGNKEIPFLISDISIRELEHIKLNKNKSDEARAKANEAAAALRQFKDNYNIITYFGNHSEQSNDEKILWCLNESRNLYNEEIIFKTSDTLLFLIAESRNFTVEFYEKKADPPYKGYTLLNCSDVGFADFYENLNKHDSPLLSSILENEYVILADLDNDPKDAYKKVNGILEKVPYRTFSSYQIGDVKPLDMYQQCLMDSLATNQFTIITGHAAAGKSYMAMAYLFSKLEAHEIDKIIMLVNPVCANGAAKLGYYKGTRDEKLLDCQIGGFLSCKLGESSQTQQYIEQGKLELIPFSDLRGLDFGGQKAGIFITEAQNLDRSLMKLAIQRAGEDSIVIIEGDPEAQLDMAIYGGDNNGMLAAIDAFKGEDLFGMIELKNIYRSRLAEIAERM